MADGPVDVRLELHPEAVLSRVWINGEEWAGSVKRLSVDVEDAVTIVTLSFYARLTAEGSLPLSPWPIEVGTHPPTLLERLLEAPIEEATAAVTELARRLNEQHPAPPAANALAAVSGWLGCGAAIAILVVGAAIGLVLHG